MCLTHDRIEQACGFLLLGEFNIFIYCCKICRAEFVTGLHLESHILSEHAGEEGGVVVNDIFVDESTLTDAPTEFDPTIVKIEPDDQNISVDDDDHINVVNECNNEINDPVAIAMAQLERSPKRPRGRPRSKVKEKNAVKRKVGRPPGSKNRKMNSGALKEETKQTLELTNGGINSNYEPTEVNTGELIQNTARDQLVRHEYWAQYDKNDEIDNESDINVDGSSSSNSIWNNSQSNKSYNNTNGGHNNDILGSESFYGFDQGESSQQKPQVLAAQKRRGRPLGVKNKKNRIGNIMKNIETVGMNSFEASKETISKRPRGRPRINRNLTPNNAGCSYVSTSTTYRSHTETITNDGRSVAHTHTVKTDSSSFNVHENIPFQIKTEFPVVKRPRGRPRKNNNVLIEVKTEHTPKRPRGRPPGSKNRIQNDIFADFGESSQSMNANFEELPLTRLRERPMGQLKWVDSDSENDINDKKRRNTDNEAYGTSSFGRKRRGRPRNKRNSYRDVLIKIKTEHSNSKKARGRPVGAKNKKKIVKPIRAIKIELEELDPLRPIGQPSESNINNINSFCKPFDIKLEDISNSGQFRHWLQPTM